MTSLAMRERCRLVAHRAQIALFCGLCLAFAWSVVFDTRSDISTNDDSPLPAEAAPLDDQTAASPAYCIQTSLPVFSAPACNAWKGVPVPGSTVENCVLSPTPVLTAQSLLSNTTLVFIGDSSAYSAAQDVAAYLLGDPTPPPLTTASRHSSSVTIRHPSTNSITSIVSCWAPYARDLPESMSSCPIFNRTEFVTLVMSLGANDAWELSESQANPSSAFRAFSSDISAAVSLLFNTSVEEYEDSSVLALYLTPVAAVCDTSSRTCDVSYPVALDTLVAAVNALDTIPFTVVDVSTWTNSAKCPFAVNVETSRLFDVTNTAARSARLHQLLHAIQLMK